MKKEILDAIKYGESKETFTSKHGGSMQKYIKSKNKIFSIITGPDGQRFEDKFVCRIVDNKPVLTGCALASAKKSVATIAKTYMASGMKINDAIAKSISSADSFLQWGDIEKILKED